MIVEHLKDWTQWSWLNLKNQHIFHLLFLVRPFRLSLSTVLYFCLLYVWCCSLATKIVQNSYFCHFSSLELERGHPSNKELRIRFGQALFEQGHESAERKSGRLGPGDVEGHWSSIHCWRESDSSRFPFVSFQAFLLHKYESACWDRINKISTPAPDPLKSFQKSIYVTHILSTLIGCSKFSTNQSDRKLSL